MFDHIPDDPDLRRAWNALALGMEHAEVFFTYEWSVAVERAYKGRLTLLLVLGYDDAGLAGVAALTRKRTGELVFLTADTADYCDFLCASSLRRQFVFAVLSELKARKVGTAVFTNLPADSHSVSALWEAGSRTGYCLHMRGAYVCAQVRLGSGEERYSLKQSVLAKKRLRKNFRELASRGTVLLEHETEWSDIRSLLPQFARAHIARFLETGKKSSLICPERRAFLEELGDELSRSGWIVFSRLVVGKVTAAWNYGFRFAGSWFWYQPTMNDCYRDLSPGHCLLAKIVEQACDSHDLDVVDLGLGAEGYKERFANSSRRTLYCEVNGSRIRHWRTIARYRAATIARASPSLETWIRMMISTLGKVREMLATEGIWGMLRRAGQRVRRLLFSHDKLLVFEWRAGARTPDTSGIRLVPLDSDALGAAALQYGNDPVRLRFFMRSAQRLRSGDGQGFVLMTADGTPVHFCWAKECEGFYVKELDRTLRGLCENTVIIFDCLTPEAARGHGYFQQAISLLARQLNSQGVAAWIFRCEADLTEFRDSEKSGFHHKFTLGRRRILFFKRISDSLPTVKSHQEHKLSAV